MCHLPGLWIGETLFAAFCVLSKVTCPFLVHSQKKNPGEPLEKKAAKVLCTPHI